VRGTHPTATSAAKKNLVKEAVEESALRINNVEGGWKFGAFKSPAKWETQMAKRGWIPQQITEAMQKGDRFAAENLVNQTNAATRYVHPVTGRSVVIDDVTKEVIHVGSNEFKY